MDGATTFAAVAATVVFIVRRRKAAARSSAAAGSKPATKGATADDADELAILSARGRHAAKPALSYLNEFLAALDDQWDAVANPRGTVVLAVAENRLGGFRAHVAPRLSRADAAGAHGEDAVECYDDMVGIARFKTALARHLPVVVAIPRSPMYYNTHGVAQPFDWILMPTRIALLCFP